jgi:glycosidase
MNSPTLLPLLLAAAFIPASVTSWAKTPPGEPPPSAQPAMEETHVPEWSFDVVWYQIFPERFRNGDPTNDPTRDSLEFPIRPSEKWRVKRWTEDWYARDDWEKERGSDFYRDYLLDRRYGGDLQGVLDELDHLADLGVNAIYFNPLFYSRSLHKYDGNSYHHIDPHFGPDPKGDFAIMETETSDPATWQWTLADKLFLKLVAAAHEREMKVIIDGVFNHTGRDFFAFKDLRRNQKNSPYKDWYIVERFDDPTTKKDEFKYKGWWNHETLPVFSATKDGKDMHPGPKKYVYDSTKRWMDPNGDGDPADGVDGWRLDVADERPVKFWAEWNAYVKHLKPEAYTTAEIWSPASELVLKGGFSACMNYNAFALPVKGFLIDRNIPASRFGKLLDERRSNYPRSVQLGMQNLIDSHDTDRVASQAVNGEGTKYKTATEIDYNQDNKPATSKTYKITRPTERHRKIQRLVGLFQMTYIGAPMIYYGTEAGMWGAQDPDNRMPMAWPDLKFDPQVLDPRGGTHEPQDVNFDSAVFKFYKDVVRLRREHAAFRRGDFQFVGAFDRQQSFAFLRRNGESEFVVAINRSDDEQTLKIKLPADEAGRWKAAKVIFGTNDVQSGALRAAADDEIEARLPALTGVVIGRD